VDPLPELHILDELAHAALDDMRALIFELHPTLLQTHGLVCAVREQAAWINRRGGPAVTVDPSWTPTGSCRRRCTTA
jgi:signal transduction histidine kinase